MGKQRGGDLRAGKKTWLLIRGLERSATLGRNELRTELGRSPEERNVDLMLAVLEELGIPDEAEAEVARYDALAMDELEAIAVPAERKKALFDLAATLSSRVH